MWSMIRRAAAQRDPVMDFETTLVRRVTASESVPTQWLHVSNEPSEEHWLTEDGQPVARNKDLMCHC